jgi:hypothetical protein
VYNTQDHWVLGLCSTSGILNTKKYKVSKIGSVSFEVYTTATMKLSSSGIWRHESLFRIDVSEEHVARNMVRSN